MSDVESCVVCPKGTCQSYCVFRCILSGRDGVREQSLSDARWLLSKFQESYLREKLNGVASDDERMRLFQSWKLEKQYWERHPVDGGIPRMKTLFNETVQILHSRFKKYRQLYGLLPDDEPLPNNLGGAYCRRLGIHRLPVVPEGRSGGFLDTTDFVGSSVGVRIGAPVGQDNLGSGSGSGSGLVDHGAAPLSSGLVGSSVVAGGARRRGSAPVGSSGERMVVAGVGSSSLCSAAVGSDLAGSSGGGHMGVRGEGSSSDIDLELRLYWPNAKRARH